MREHLVAGHCRERNEDPASKEEGGWLYGPGKFCRPERLVIFSKRDVPSVLILASRRSRRRRACFWPGVSIPVEGEGSSMATRLVDGRKDR